MRSWSSCRRRWALSVSWPQREIIQRADINNLQPTRAGFHEFDSIAFDQKLFAPAAGTKSQDITGIATISLQSVLRGCHDSTATKLKVLGALLTKEIVVVGNAGGTIGTLH